jgi:CheY-like chemotaxis protein
VKHALDVIDRSVRAQVRLINDLLDLSRLVRGKVELEKKPVDLAAVVEAALETMSPAAAEKRLAIEKRLEPFEGYVEGDPQRIEQVAGNLIHNALKFTPDGGRIEVELQRVAWPDQRPAAVLTVRDTGVGIAPHVLPRIFDRFRQGDSSFTRRHGGLGLGLAIARSLIEMHGGTLRAESEGEGKGSAFIVALPLVDEALPAAVPAPSKEEAAEKLPEGSALASVRILVVDDDPFARELLRRSLEPHGAVVKTVASAAEGFKVFQELAPQILVCDIAMPLEDGYTLIRKIRALPRESGKEARAIALTAFVSEADRHRAITSGFNAFLPKPVEPMDLVKTATQLLA